jgi:hypothetical protein
MEFIMKKIIQAGALCLCLCGLLIAGCSEAYVDSDKIYTVTFFPNGGVVSGRTGIDEKTSMETDAKGRLSSLPSATRKNEINDAGEEISFTLVGWFTPGNTEVTTKTVFNYDALVVARWKASDEKDTEEPGALANWLAFLRDSDPPPTIDFKVNVDEIIKPQKLAFGGKPITIKLWCEGESKALYISGFGALFTVESGVTLILENIQLEGSRNTASLIVVNDGGKLIMRDWAVIARNGNQDKDYGGGVTVNIGGVFEMTGGLIYGNTAIDPTQEYYTSSAGGGGVCVRGGTFTMTGGQITENQGVHGGGVLVRRGGTFTMEIPDGYIPPDYKPKNQNEVYIPIFKNVSYEGGGVKVISGQPGNPDDLDSGYYSKFYFKRGIISENEGGGGGIAVGARGILYMYEGTEIYKNEGSDAAGLYNRGVVYMFGGKITENRAPWSAGGIANSGGTIYMKGGEISNNYGGLGGGVVNGGFFHMWDGAKIFGNIGDGSGGGVANTGFFYMYGGEIYGNTANIGLGGGVNNGTASNTYAGTFHMTGGIIYGLEPPENLSMIEDPKQEYYNVNWATYKNEDHGSGGVGGTFYVVGGTLAWGRRGYYYLENGLIRFKPDTRYEKGIADGIEPEKRIYFADVAAGIPKPVNIYDKNEQGDLIPVPTIEMGMDGIFAKLKNSNKTIRVDPDYGVYLDGIRVVTFSEHIVF